MTLLVTNPVLVQFSVLKLDLATSYFVAAPNCFLQHETTVRNFQEQWFMFSINSSNT